jgi:deoxyribonuclease-4
MRAGFHLSIKDGIDKVPITANKLGYSNFQIFTRSSRSWKFKELDPETISIFKQNCEALNFDTKVIHLPYLPNFSTSDVEIRTKSLDSLVEEVKRADLLNINLLVIHIGSHKGEGISSGIELVSDAVNLALNNSKNVNILLETSAGYKNSVGSKFSELMKIIDNVSLKKRVGICFDTCHVFAAGYDLRTKSSVIKVIDNFDSEVGMKYLKLIHLNDSKTELGGGSDRHEHIGKGKIGLTGFEVFLNENRIKDIPIILETPNTSSYGDKENFELITKILDP